MNLEMGQLKQYAPEEDRTLLEKSRRTRKIILSIVSIFVASIGFILGIDTYRASEYSVLSAIVFFVSLQVPLVYYEVGQKIGQGPLSLLIFAILSALFGNGSDGSLWMGLISMIISTILIFSTYISWANLSPKLKLVLKIIGIPIIILVSVFVTIMISKLGGAYYSGY